MCTALWGGNGRAKKLVEQVCQRIVTGLREELPLAEAVEVKVTKFQPHRWRLATTLRSMQG